MVCSSCSPRCSCTVILTSPVEIWYPKSLCKSSKKSNSCISNLLLPADLSPYQFPVAPGSYWSSTNFAEKCQDKELEARDQNLKGVETQVLVKITGIQNTIHQLPWRDPTLDPQKRDIFIEATHSWRTAVLPCGSSAFSFQKKERGTFCDQLKKKKITELILNIFSLSGGSQQRKKGTSGSSGRKFT